MFKVEKVVDKNSLVEGKVLYLLCVDGTIFTGDSVQDCYRLYKGESNIVSINSLDYLLYEKRVCSGRIIKSKLIIDYCSIYEKDMEVISQYCKDNGYTMYIFVDNNLCKVS